MSEPFYVDTDGVTSLRETHDGVAAAVRQLAGSAPAARGLEARYGTIASPFTSALGQALPSRDATLRAAASSSETIGKLLQAAARLYEQGDEEGAEELGAAAEALAGSDRAGGGVAVAPGGLRASSAGMSGADPAAQMGQQVGQLAQSMAQSVAGLAQGLTQLPQQIVQGVQGVVGSVSKASGSSELKGAGTRSGDVGEEDSRDGAEKRLDEESDREAKKDLDQERAEGRHAAPPTRNDGAQAGRPADGHAPPAAPPAERPQPAQTRPQQTRP